MPDQRVACVAVQASSGGRFLLPQQQDLRLRRAKCGWLQASVCFVLTPVCFRLRLVALGQFRPCRRALAAHESVVTGCCIRTAFVHDQSFARCTSLSPRISSSASGHLPATEAVSSCTDKAGTASALTTARRWSLCCRSRGPPRTAPPPSWAAAWRPAAQAAAARLGGRPTASGSTSDG